MKKNKLINKQVKKKSDGKCHFCEENDYCVLDVHRITEGKDGGKYTDFNTVTACSVCHRKIHAGKIKVFRKYLSSNGRYVLHYIDEQGREQFK